MEDEQQLISHKVVDEVLKSIEDGYEQDVVIETIPHLNNATDTEDLNLQRRSSEASSSHARRPEIHEQMDDRPIRHVSTFMNEQQPATHRPIHQHSSQSETTSDANSTSELSSNRTIASTPMLSQQRRQHAITPEQIYNQSQDLRQFEYSETDSLADSLQTVDQLPTRLPLTRYQPNSHENQSMELYNPNPRSFNGMSDGRQHLVHQTITQNAGNPSISISLNTTAGGTAGGTSGGKSGDGESAILELEEVKSYLLCSLMTCVIVNWIFGSVSLLLSCISRKKAAKGDREGARKFGIAALYANIANIIISLALLLVLIVYVTT